MAATPYVSVVLACYNEEEVLEKSVPEIRDVLEDLQRPWEIIFVDDLSRDRTREIIARYVREDPERLRAILHERNCGRGATVTDGFRAARGEITGYLDVDLEVHARYIPSLVKAIEKGADIATVRRIYAFQVRHVDRWLMSSGYSWLVRRLLRVGLHDTETGYKFFRRQAVLRLLDEIEDPGWFWDTEFMVRGLRRGFRIEEVVGAYLRRDDKTSTVSGVRDSIQYFGKVWRFRRALRRQAD